MKKKKLTTRKVNAIIASAMAVTLAIPSVVFLGDAKVAEAANAAEESTLPEPIAFYDFERGFSDAGIDSEGESKSVTLDKNEAPMYVTDANGNKVTYRANGKQTAEISNQPVITTSEGVAGNVFTLNDTVTTDLSYEKAPTTVSGSNGYDENGNIITSYAGVTAHSGATIENPYKGRTDLVEDPNEIEWDENGYPVWNTGVTISYWVKGESIKDATGDPILTEDGNKTAKDSSILSFNNSNVTKNDMVHKDSVPRYQASKLFVESSGSAVFDEGEPDGKVQLNLDVVATPVGYVEELWAEPESGYCDKDGNPTTDSAVAIKKHMVDYNGTYKNQGTTADGKNYFRGMYYSTAFLGVTAEGCSVSSDNIVGSAEIGGIDKACARADQWIKLLDESDKRNNLLWNKSTFTQEFAKTLKVNDILKTQKSGYYKVVKEDAANGMVELEYMGADPDDLKAGFEKEVELVKNFGMYANYKKDMTQQYWLLPSTDADGNTTYKVDKVATYDRSKTAAADAALGQADSTIKYGKEPDAASLSFKFSGSWGFRQSPERQMLYEGDKESGMNFLQGDNQSYVHSITNWSRNTYADASLVNQADTWVFVTYVIQNDHVSTYYNGKLMDRQLYYAWGNAGVNKSGAFNLGSGYSGGGILNRSNNSHTNSEACGLNKTSEKLGSNNYTGGLTIMELLTSEDTEIQLGGAGLGDNVLTMAVGTAKGTSIDDLAFYDEAFLDEDVKALYDQAVASREVTEPNKIASYSFDDLDGVEEPASNGETSKVSVVDEERGSVLKLEAGLNDETAAAKIKNPYQGNRDIVGATVTYWMREEVDEDGIYNDNPVLTFMNEPETYNFDGFGDGDNDNPASTVLYTKTSGAAQFMAGYTGNQQKNLKNHFNVVVDTDIVDKKEAEWHQYAIVMENSGLTMYRDGELLPNTCFAGTPSQWTMPGPRFYDGYYALYRDLNIATSEEAPGGTLDKTIFGSTNNAYQTSVLSFLTGETTDLYLGYLTKLGYANQYEYTSPMYIDDLEFYDQALTAEQIAQLYSGESFEGVYGDVDGNGEVNTRDAILLLRHLSDSEGTPLSGDAIIAANVDGSVDEEGTPTLTTRDAIWILRYLADKDNVIFPVLQNKEEQ